MINYDLIRQGCRSWYIRDVGCISSLTFMYLCVFCYCDACLKSSALRVGVKTLYNTLCQLVKEFNTNSGTIYLQDASLDILAHTTFI